MTREEAKELLPIMQAFADGKTIQVWYNDTWQDEEYPSFGELSLFRIKPEPKYRPFKTKEECWNEMLKHQPLGWIRESNTKILYNISMIDDGYLSTQDQSKHLVDTLNIYEFLDGTPFGIKEE